MKELFYSIAGKKVMIDDYGDEIVTVHPERLIQFYQHQGRDNKGRYLRDIWDWSNGELESTHDYIQWLFPLDELSAYNKVAPVLDPRTINVFKTSTQIQSNLHSSLQCMLRFYGFQINDGIICPGSNFQDRTLEWVTPNNHNFLRVSRILRSLSLLYSVSIAEHWLKELKKLSDDQLAVIGTDSIRYWENAVT